MDNSRADLLREEGNDYYKGKDYDSAISKYDEALKYNQYDYRILSNKAAAYHGLKDYSSAEEVARQSYLLNQNNVKGYYRAAEAAIEKKRFREAFEYVMVGLHFNPCSSDLINLDRRLRRDYLELVCHEDELMIMNVKREILKVKDEHSKLFEDMPFLRADTNGSLDEEETNKENQSKAPQKNGPSTPKKKPAKKDPPKTNTKKDIQKLVNKHASEGSRFYFDGAAKPAAEKFLEALSTLGENYDLKVVGMEVLIVDVVRYSYAVACIDTAESRYIAYGIETLEQMTTDADKRFPFVYLTIGKGYVNLNLFKLALEPLLKGLDVIKLRPQKYCAWYWPGYPKKPIEDTTASANIKEKLTDFLEICKNPPNPDAFCRYALCDFQYPFTDSKHEIYFSDPDFRGFYDIGCSERCRIQYHLTCWKNFKTTMDKKTDKDLYGMKCVTPDCDGTINEVKMVEADGSEVVIGYTSIEELPGKQKRTSKLEKRAEQKLKKKVRRDDRDTIFPSTKDDDSRVILEETDYESKDLKTTIVKKLKKERKNTLEGEEETFARSDSPVKSNQKPKAAPLPIDIDDSEIKVLKKNDGEEQSVKTKKPKESKKKKSEKCFIIMDDMLGTPDDNEVVDNSFDRCLASLAKEQDSRYGSSPFTNIFSEQLPGWSSVEDASLVDTPAAASLITFFMQFVQSNGPLETDSGMLLDIVQQLPTDSQEIVANVGGLRSFLLTNRQFASLDELICCLGDVNKAAEVTLTAIRSKLKVPIARAVDDAQDYPSLEEVNPIEDKWESEEEDDDDDDDDEDWREEFDSQRTESPDNTVFEMMRAVAYECKQKMSNERQVCSSSGRSDISLKRTARTTEVQIQTDMSSSDIADRDQMIHSLFEKIREHEETIKRQMDTKTKMQNKTVAEIAELKKRLDENSDKLKQSEIAKREVYSNWESEKKKLAADRKKGLDEVKKALEDKKKSIREKEAAETEMEKQKNQKEKAEQNLLTLTVQVDQLSERAEVAESNVKALQKVVEEGKKRLQTFQLKHLETLSKMCATEVERVRSNCQNNLTCLKKAETLVHAGSSPSSAEISDAMQQWFHVFGKVTQMQTHFEFEIDARKKMLRDGRDISDIADLSLPTFNDTAPMPLNPNFPIENQIQFHPASTALSQLLKQIPQQPPPTNGFPNFLVPPPLPNSSLASFLTPPPNLTTPSTSAGLSNLLTPPSQTFNTTATEDPKTAPLLPASNANLQNTHDTTERKAEPEVLGATAESDSCSSRSSTPSFGSRYFSSYSSDETKIFVGKIPLRYTEKDIANMFSKFVPVVDVSLRLSGHSSNFAFVTLESAADRDLILSRKPFHLDNKHLLNVEAKVPKDQQMPPYYIADKAGPPGPRLRFEHKREEIQQDQDKTFFVHPASRVAPKQPPAAAKPHSPVETAAMDAIKNQSSSKIEEMITKMHKRLPSFTRQEVIAFVVQVRDSRPNRSLQGWTEDAVLQEVRKLAKNKAGGSSSNGGIVGGMGGLEDFSAPPVAWGGKGTKTQETNFKDAEDECAICYEKIHRKSETPLSCGHTFHRSCVERWVKEQSTCPKCRKHVLLPDEFPSLQ